MSTPGKEALTRKKYAESQKNGAYKRKSVAMSGSDAKGAMKRKEQPVPNMAQRILKRLRKS